MKRVIGLLTAVTLMVFWAAPVSAAAPMIGISVTPTSINFGAVEPGVASGSQSVTVTNTGDVDEDFSAVIANESPTGVYTGSPGLTMDGNPLAAWLPTNVAPAGTVSPALILTVPSATAPGTYTATLVFWAVASP